MKKAVGGAYVYNLVIVFLLIMFGFFLALFSYTKAYRVSKSIIAIIENHSGYNANTQKDIDVYLKSMGYNANVNTCPQRKNAAGEKIDAIKSTKKDSDGKEVVTSATAPGLCIYEVSKVDSYITYGVLSYMTIDLPLIDLIKIPIYGETSQIYVFK